MSMDGKGTVGWHLLGLVLALLLGGIGVYLYLNVPNWITNTWLRGFGNLVTFGAVIVILSLAQWAVTGLVARLTRQLHA